VGDFDFEHFEFLHYGRAMDFFVGAFIRQPEHTKNMYYPYLVEFLKHDSSHRDEETLRIPSFPNLVIERGFGDSETSNYFRPPYRKFLPKAIGKQKYKNPLHSIISFC